MREREKEKEGAANRKTVENTLLLKSRRLRSSSVFDLGHASSAENSTTKAASGPQQQLLSTMARGRKIRQAKQRSKTHEPA